MNPIKFFQSFLLLLIVVSMTACSGTAQPTATSAPTEPPKPSATSVPPTSTPLPPTNTAVSPTNTAAPTNTTAPTATTIAATATLAPTNTKVPVATLAPTTAPVVPTVAPVQPTATSAPALPAGQGRLTVINTFPSTKAQLAIWGPTDMKIDVEPGKTVIVNVPTGSYGWSVYLSDGRKLVPVGNFPVNPDNTITIAPAGASPAKR